MPLTPPPSRDKRHSPSRSIEPDPALFSDDPAAFEDDSEFVRCMIARYILGIYTLSEGGHEGESAVNMAGWYEGQSGSSPGYASCICLATCTVLVLQSG